MVHLKKEKGDIAVAQAITDLTMKGFAVFIPVITEHLPFDIIAYKENRSYRIQTKHSSNGTIQDTTCWSDKHGTHVKKYEPNDFDYYAIYLPEVKAVVYPALSFGGAKLTTIVPNSATPFYWWEDFINLTDSVNKKTYKDFGKSIIRESTDNTIKANIKKRKVERPSKEELEKLLWEIPTVKIAERFNVSDTAVSKWAKHYGLQKPERGYWTYNDK